MPTPPVSGLLLWLSADQGVSQDGSGRVTAWAGVQSSLPSFSQPDAALRPVFVSSVLDGYPGIQFSDGVSLGVQGLGIAGADFTLFVLGRSLSEQSSGSGSGSTGRRFLFQQTLTRNIQGDTRPFVVAVSVGSNGMALYELDLDDVPRTIIAADMSVFCPLTVGYREGVPLASLCSQILVQPSVVTGYQLGVAPGTGNGFDGIVAEVLLYQGILSDSDRLTVEQYLEDKYQCCDSSSSSSDSSDSSSSDSSSSESSDSSSSDSSNSSSSDSSDSLSSESSASSSSDFSSSDSSESSDSSSSDSSSSSCVLVLPSNPTPVIDGLVAWYRSDIHVTQNGNQVTVWGAVCDCLPDAVSIGTTPPIITPTQFGEYPGIGFDLEQGLQIQGGELADDSFTMFVIGRATGERQSGGSGTAGQRLLFFQTGDGSNAWPSVSVGTQSIGVYEYGPSDIPRADFNADAMVLCPLVIRYENRQLSVWLRGELVCQDTTTPGSLHLAHNIGGTGDSSSGFVGALAEIIFYNRALSDAERQQVEAYLQTRYGCLPESSSSDSSDESSSSDSSDSSSSDSSSSDSSDSSSSDSSDSSDSTDSSSSDSSDSSESDSSSCTVTASFEVQHGADKINQGFDPVRLPTDPADAPVWASVCYNSTNTVVKLVITPAESAPDVELQIVDGSGVLQINPMNGFTEADTNLSLESNEPETTVGITEATVHAVCKSTGDVLAKMKVLVLPLRTIPISIYEIFDSTSPGTFPTGAPQDAALLQTLNEVFRQAGIRFVIEHSEALDVQFDGYQVDTGFVDEDQKNGFFDEDEIGALDPNAVPGTFRLLLFRRSTSAFGALGHGDGGSLAPGASIFCNYGQVALVCAHEIGHWLELSTRDIDHNAGDGPHDGPPWPVGTSGFMETNVLVGQLGRWLRHQDWRKANEEAAKHEQ